MEISELSPALIETLGIEDFTLRREFGRERGLNPTPTEAHKREIEALNQKLTQRASQSTKGKNQDEEEQIVFDLKGIPRVILFQGKVLKRSFSSIVQHTSRRHMVLLNDVLLICSIQSSGSLVNFMTERLSAHQVFPLDQISIVNLKNLNPDEDPCAFEIRTAERPYQMIAESESDKKIWLEELESAIFCIMAANESKKLGWQHEIVLGTIHSAAVLNDCDLLRRYIDDTRGTLDVADESGMTPLHWASMFGHSEAVQMLVEAGSDIDFLNSGLNSSLLLAAAFGHDDIVLSLINNGADVFLRNLKDIDCLYMAVLYGHRTAGLKNIISVLQATGVKVNKLDMLGSTPLHECAARNLAGPVQVLVDAGADVNMKHGRNGLTPLQMACSVMNPDPETVRSFLEKGAHPNWKDTAKRSAFDMVLCTYQLRTKNRKSQLTNNDPGMSMGDPVMDEVVEFVQTALPVLIEIVKKGGRYSEESVANLRSSFKEAILTGKQHWNAQQEPENFQRFLAERASGGMRVKPDWLPDATSQHCLLCLDKFTYSNRRHHCRACGILCCDLCSMKRLNISHVRVRQSTGTISPVANSKDGKQSDSHRCCDGCFNRYSYEYVSWMQAKAKMEKAAAEAVKLRPVEEVSTPMTPTTPKSDGGRSRSTTQASTKNPQSLKVNGSVATAQSAMAEAGKALEERGQRLQETAERSEEMLAAASDFKASTKKLLEQQQQKASWYGTS